ncbi:hypothetical protein PG994_014130 [Apiospora phragmitis]|uniref:Zn(2)-C6 fungal-type domain-containing protein n=1 Tax=Apiospora phragmitis TaxID=2905665 RepID=A0ABR1T3G6_9PEZI
MFTTLDLNTANSKQSSSGGRSEEGEGETTDLVRRACDWCKLMRIKCDNDRPCYNCQQGGRECGMNNKNQFRSLAAAVKEVEILRAQMRELETSKRQLEELHKSASTGAAERRRSSPSNSPLAERQMASRNGVRVGSILWGMASWPFFLVRLNQYLHAARPHLDVDLLACVAGMPASPWLRPDALSASFLPIYQERHFLSLFWQTHYFSFPFVSEAQFRREYHELTADTAPSATRKPSPLVDIVLALCIQLGSLRMNRAGDAQTKCPSLAGFQYYRRGQQAIDQTIETPNLRTVQCYVYSIVYLLEAGFLNRAQVVAGKAITVALLLGLSHEPPLDIPEPEREVARRTWWSLYSLDALLSMEVGRPPMISASHSTCQLPTDSLEVAQWLAPHYRHDDSCPPWVGFQTQTLHLFRAVRPVRAAFNATYDAVIGQNSYDVFVNNGEAREECARALMEPIKELEQWTQAVPSGYVVPRKEGRAFSQGERSTLDLDLKPNVLIHCQRQRLLLEMQYYNQCMALYQPFICVGAGAGAESSSPTPLSDGMAATGLGYAVALTSMIYQALTGSEALSGAYSVLRLQKNALFAIIGFAYTFPLTQRDAIGRALDEGLAVVERYQDALPDARATAAAVRALSDDIGTVMHGGFYDEPGGWSSSSWLTAASGSGTSPVALLPSGSGTSISSDTIVVASQDGSAAGSLPTMTTGLLDKQGLVTPTIMSPGLMTEAMFDFNAFDMGGGLDVADMGTGWDYLDILWGGMELGEPPKDPWAMMDISVTTSGKNDEMPV